MTYRNDDGERITLSCLYEKHGECELAVDQGRWKVWVCQCECHKP